MRIRIGPDFAEWRARARELLHAGIAPDQVELIDSTADLNLGLGFEEPPPLTAVLTAARTAPKQFLELAETVACHRDPTRWRLLYRLLWRLQSERGLLHHELDPDIAEITRMNHQVSRDLHKMHAFVRFRKVVVDGDDHYIAWYRPDHRILPLAAPFFAERFAVMRWSILTPDASVAWDPATKRANFGPGAPREAAPAVDELESMWQSYYSSIFNPARLNPRAMRAEMPTRYWHNLPELQVLPTLMTQAKPRVEAMITQQKKSSAAAYLPASHTLPELARCLPECRGCELYQHATQAVFGSGPASAELMLVGEQPGDEEDRSGAPFVGPAGKMLDRALEEAEVDRSRVYVTNAVKHFKFVERGKRRLHQSPRMSEITACRPWLEAEVEAVKPRVVVLLGAAAAKSLLGAKFALMKDRGKLVSASGVERAVATMHPSAILSAIDPETGRTLYEYLKADLRFAHETALKVIA